TLPALPALKTIRWVRLPPVACAATRTVAADEPPPASEPCAGVTVMAASSALAVQVRPSAPLFDTLSVCAPGALGASAWKCSEVGLTTSLAGSGGGGCWVKVIDSGTTILPALPASKVRCEVREPALLCPATDTVTMVSPLGSSAPAAAERLTL